MPATTEKLPVALEMVTVRHEGAVRSRRHHVHRLTDGILVAVLSLLIVAGGPPAPASAGSPAAVDTEAELKRAWENPRTRAISIERDIFLRACRRGSPIRESSRPLTLNGNGHTIRQTCFEKRLLRQDGTGFLVIKNVTLTRGGNDGPGAAVTTRGEIVIKDSEVTENLAEEPGGAIFSQRRATIIRSVITGNLANDDGGGVYARRGGIEVYDSIISNNLVDGSGGALGSTGDILVVRSHVDGNTTDGDGGAIYTDEDGDVTVIDSTVDGNTADGPGGAIFTLEGDVTDHQLDRERQPRRRSRRGDLGRGRRDGDRLDDRPQRRVRARRRGDLGPQRSVRDQLDDQPQLRRGPGRRGPRRRQSSAWSTRPWPTTSPRSPQTWVQDRVSRPSARSSAHLTREPVGGQIQPIGPSCRVSRPESFGYNFVSDAPAALTARAT